MIVIAMEKSMLFIFLGSFILKLVSSSTCTWDNCPNWSDDNMAYVHFVPHTHDDMGWLKTADDYYTGANPNEVDHLLGVNLIISTMVDELTKDPKRRFSYCETGYLTRWIEDTERTENDLEKLKNLVVSGQLEFIGGGWVQPDEATTHYVALIDQYTLGLQKLNHTFGECGKPKVAWQIDPFGHSREHANLMKLMGYEGLFFAREHYLEHNMRTSSKNLEFNWTVSDDTHDQLFTGVFYNGYGPPGEFCWDTRCSGTDPVVSNPNMENFNVEKIYSDFTSYIFKQSFAQPHKHFLMLMGSDFHYTNAKMSFSNMDKFINYINSNAKSSGLAAFYSTPSCYMQAVKEYMQTGAFIPNNKTTDFFPYASGEHSYWTGYFTSKPAMKGLVRQSSALLQLIRQLDVLALNDVNLPMQLNSEEIFERAISLAQHHDGISGTSKEFVTKDYERRMLKGWDQGENLLNIAVERISQRTLNNGYQLPRQSICRTINETDCVFVKYNDKYVVTVYNPNSKETTSLVKIPYYGADESDNVTVSDNMGTVISHIIIQTNIITFGSIPTQLQSPTVAKHQLWFPVTVGPLGVRSYFVNTNGNTKKALKQKVKAKNIFEEKINNPKETDGETVISNQYYKLTFDANGQLSTLQDLTSQGQDIYNITQEFLWYEGATNFYNLTILQQQASGAYVFRPQPGTLLHNIQFNFTPSVITHLVTNDLFQELQQTFDLWVTQSVRLYHDKPFVEFEYTVGPLPNDITNLHSHEVITRYTVNSLNDIPFTNAGLFTTDANGRQHMKRARDTASDYVYNNSEPVAANYYPVNSRIILTDKDKMKSLVILTDRSQAGGSLEDGQVELLIHRRDFFDDGYGVDEALNEPGFNGSGLVVRGRHWLMLTDKGVAEQNVRFFSQEMFYSPVVAFSQYSSISSYTSSYLTQLSGLKKSFPQNVNLLTLKQIDTTSVLIRVEHIFQSGEDTVNGCGQFLGGCSAPVTIDLTEYFATFTILGAKELSLGGNDWIDGPSVNVTQILLNPMQIRTFLLNVQLNTTQTGQIQYI